MNATIPPVVGTSSTTISSDAPEAALQQVARLLTSLGGRLTASVAAAGTVDTDVSTGAFMDVTATGSFTLDNPTEGGDSKRFEWRIWNNSVADITVTFGDQFNFAQGVSAPPAISAGSVGYVTARFRTLGGVTKWDVVAAWS